MNIIKLWAESGAMGSYVAFNLLGLYPLPATKEFLIPSPFFKSVKIRNPLLGTTTTISTRGLQRNLTDEGRNIYVKVRAIYTFQKIEIILIGYI